MMLSFTLTFNSLLEELFLIFGLPERSSQIRKQLSSCDMKAWRKNQA